MYQFPNRSVENVTSGEDILTFLQKDMSDQYYGPGAEALKLKLKELKDNKS